MNGTVETANRVMYWHINSPYKFFIYPLIFVSMGIFAYGAYKKFLFWKAGQPDAARFGDWTKRILTFIWEIPFQAKVLGEKQGGIMHVLIFWSFLALMATTAVVFVHVDFGVSVYKGIVYLFFTVLSDLCGLALFVGLIIAAVRRYIVKPEKMENRWDDAFALLLLGLTVVTGFFLEAMRIHYAGDKWAAFSPVGYAMSFMMGNLSDTGATRVYQAGWWVHFATMFAFIASLPYTKFFHIFTLPANVFFASTRPKGALDRVDIEKLMSDEAAMENFNVGVSAVKDLTWKNRLDYDACIRCGRCEDVCPSFQNQKPLSPKKFIGDMKTFAWNNFNGNGHKAAGNGHGAAEGEAAPAAEATAEEPPLIVGSCFDQELIWECRTCRACMEVCPAHIEHIPQIMELRRGEVMMRGQMPGDANVALKTLERGGNPFGPQEERSNWIAENQIPVVAPGEECDVLFWIGCCTTYDLLKQKVAYNILRILMQAGIKVGVLGTDENCCGDPARLLGDENLFQTIAKTQIEAIQSRKFKYMITHCPHCYNVFKNEYPQFGATFEVRHHTEVIYEMIRNGELKLDLPIERKVTYHDPCYLARYNGRYEEPRAIIKSIKGVEFREMENNREKARCCGGGGGHYWMDIPTGKRINVSRVEEAIAIDADIIAVGCVFCLQMIMDAVKLLDLDEKMEVKDISELVIAAMGYQADVKKLPACVSQPVRAAAA